MLFSLRPIRFKFGPFIIVTSFFEFINLKIKNLNLATYFKDFENF